MKSSMMNIGEAARFSGVSAKMIRYYEQIGLVPPATRTEAGYRGFSLQDAHSLRFIRRARDLGFSVEKIADLLALWRDRERASADVKQVALSHVAALEAKISELQGMAQTLQQLADHCHGDGRPDCPIIADLALATEPQAETEPPSARRRRAPRFGVDTPASSRSRDRAADRS